ACISCVDYGREQHAHGYVVDKVGGKIGAYAVFNEFVEGERLGYVPCYLHLIEREDDYEHRDYEGYELIGNSAERVTDDNGLFVPDKAEKKRRYYEHNRAYGAFQPHLYAYVSAYRKPDGADYQHDKSEYAQRLILHGR